MWSALLLQVWGAKTADLPKLMGFRRPWDKPAEKKQGTSNPAEIAAFLARAGR